MTMQFQRGEEDTTLISDDGEFDTSDNNANVCYSFDRCGSVNLTIDGQEFSNEDLEDLIAFLQFAQENLY